MSRFTAVALILLGGAIQVADAAEDRKAYKHVDKDGKITYSQTPPVDGKAAAKVSIAPAHAGRGGDTRSYSHYDDPRIHTPRGAHRPPVAAVGRKPTPEEQRMAALKAECERNRGSDRNDPEALRALDSTKIPRRRY